MFSFRVLGYACPVYPIQVRNTFTTMTATPNHALQRMLRAAHVSCIRRSPAHPSASLSLESLGDSSRLVRTTGFSFSLAASLALSACASAPQPAPPTCYTDILA